MLRFIVIGITDTPEPYLPPEVLEEIRRGRVFSGGRRHHDLVAPLLPTDARWIDVTVPLATVFESYRKVGEAAIIVFASGDPLFYGFAVTLQREFPEAEIRVVPSFNSLQMLAHRLVMPYHDMRVVSLTGRPWQELDRALIEGAPMIGILTDREHTPEAIRQRMYEYGYTNYRLYVGERLGNPELERVYCVESEKGKEKSEQLSAVHAAMPNCVIAVMDNPSGEPTDALTHRRRFGLPESEFALLDGREKMITKMPIRLQTLQALDLPQRRVLWDIGACTGSVSIEARLQFPHLQVVAFEVRPECEAIIHENARRFGVPGMQTVMGDFLTADLAGLPRPDAVFVGGHGGNLRDIMARVLTVLDDGGVIVMNSVTSAVVERMTDHRPSSRQLWDEACAELGLVQEPPLRIQLNDNNPIEILKTKKTDCKSHENSNNTYQ